MNTQEKRNALKKAYSGEAWSKRVDKMLDDQVVAVYLRLKLKNKV